MITYDSSTVPTFSAYLLPDVAESSLGQHVNSELGNLASITDTVASQIELFNLSNDIWIRQEEERRADWQNKERQRQTAIVRHWPFVAAQSVAISIHHFGLLRGAINASWRQLPTIAPMIERDPIRQSGKLFNKYFPRTEMLRDAVCHSAELSKTPQSRQDNATKEPGQPRFFIRAFLSGSKLQYTKEGKLWELDISQDTLAKLIEVRDLYFSAFWKIEPELLRRAEEARQQRIAARTKPVT
jgi:hypothetical protein